MNNSNNIYKTSPGNYFKIIYNTITKPEKVLSTPKLSIYQIAVYLILSAFLYAVIANFIKTLAPFLLLLISPISVIPHTFFLALFLYLIFGKLYQTNFTLKESFKIIGYILIAMLPFMAIVFVSTRDTLPILLIKTLPFIYFLVLTYRATATKFKNIKKEKLIQGNVLACLSSFFVSTIIFTVNMAFVTFVNDLLFQYHYEWKDYYH
jgi:hypothetical protein